MKLSRIGMIGLALLSVSSLPAKADNAPVHNGIAGQLKFARTCAAKGLERLRQNAEVNGSILHEETFAVCEVDSRWYNPSKYVWYCAKATSRDGSAAIIQTVVQYRKGECY